MSELSRIITAFLRGDCAPEDVLTAVDRFSGGPDALNAELEMAGVRRLPVALQTTIAQRLAQRRATVSSSPERSGGIQSGGAPGYTGPKKYTVSDPDATLLPEAQGRDVNVGDVLNNRFELVEILGQGGMGQVFKAVDRVKAQFSERDQYLAIKVLGDAFRRHPNAFIAFQREARKAQQLTHHNICRVYDFSQDGDVFYMTMEYLSGQPLEKIIKQQGFAGMPLAEATTILEQVCAALEYAHGSKIVHYDLKPGNIFCTKNGPVKLIDFGIARAIKAEGASDGDQTIMPGMLVPALSPAFASPEMLEGLPPDQRDDIYALGCVAYMLLTGRHPFDRERSAKARDLGLKPKCPTGLNKPAWSAIKRALAFERSARTASAAVFLEELKGDGKGSHEAAILAGSIAAGLSVAGIGFWLINSQLDLFNTSPVARDDSIEILQGNSKQIEVLQNDTDADGDTLTIMEIVAPRFGDAWIERGQRTIFYQPHASHIGDDTITYTISDGRRGGSATAELRIVVVPVDGPIEAPPRPVAEDDSVITVRNTSVDLRPLENDSHPSGASIRLDQIVEAPTHGQATILPPGTIRYSPNSGYVGEDSFRYSVKDSDGQTASARVTVTVVPEGGAPPIARDDHATTVRNQAITVDVLANDVDPDGDPLTVVKVDRAGASGFAAIAPGGRTVIYRPRSGFSGEDGFSYTIEDNTGRRGTARVRITVESPDPRPDRTGLLPLVEDVACSILDVSVDDRRVTVRGAFGPDTPVTTVRSRLLTSPGVEELDWQAVELSEAHCAPLDVYRPLVIQARAMDGEVSISTPQTVFQQGDYLIVDARSPGYDAHLYVDYFTLDGNVVHLWPRPGAEDEPLPPVTGKSIGRGGGSGQFVVGPPFGDELLVAMASRTPLFRDGREEVEKTADYLEALRDSIGRLTPDSDGNIPLTADSATVKIAPPS